MEMILVAVVAVCVGGAVAFFLLRRAPESVSSVNELLLLQNQIADLAKTMDNRMGESVRFMQESSHSQFSTITKVVSDVVEKITRLDETNKQVVNFTDQLQDLSDILKNPKQRGILGEYYLETLLKNVLPPGSYECQYKLGKDETGHDLIPDAVVFVKEKIIPIDSKFSLENYNRFVSEKNQTEKERLEKVFVSDLKNRIVETSKYIQPTQGTMDFAFMFIPHEAIYYDLLVNKIGSLKDEENENLIQRAASKYKVIIVSPTSFLAYLQTVLQGLNAMKIEEKAQDIIKNVLKLQEHLKKYEEHHQKLGSALGTVVNHYNSSSKDFKLVDKDVMRLTGDSLGIELPTLDKPEEIV